jgi:hypothetical protein
MDNSNNNQNQPENSELGIGAPLAIATNCRIDEAKAVIVCGKCGQKLRIDLITDQISSCPRCRAEYSTALLICDPKDPDALEELADILGTDADEEPEEEQEEEPDEIPEAVQAGEDGESE